jgi:hypothetical protein
VKTTSGSQPEVELDSSREAAPPGTAPEHPLRALGLRRVARLSLARIFWSLSSFLVVFIAGVGTGLRRLDGSAPWVRSGILLSALALLVMLTRAVNTSLAMGMAQREALTQPPLRKKVVGPFRRWAIWLSSASTACATAYLLNEHGPGKPTLVPARVVNVIVIAAGASLIAPYFVDLYRGSRPRNWPWSRPGLVDHRFRESDDVIGAISRMSPPLLFAMCLAFIMFIAVYTVGIYEPVKLLGGFGVLGLFCAGLLAAPSLLQVQATEIEPMWRARWYEGQRNAARDLRAAVVKTHRVVIVTQVALMGGTLGFVTSGSGRVSAVARMTMIALVLGVAGFALARALWMWAPSQSDEEPICADALIPRADQLMRLAGWALVGGSLCSLAAVLVG